MDEILRIKLLQRAARNLIDDVLSKDMPPEQYEQLHAGVMFLIGEAARVSLDSSSEIISQLRSIRSHLEDCTCKATSDGLAHMVVPEGGRGGAHTSLADWLRGARILTIADGYFFQKGSYSSERQLLEDFFDLLPSTLRRVEVYHRPRPNKGLISDFISIANSRGLKTKFIPTWQIHDRVWIRDRERAIVVGTSFNGLGSKVSFILDLPEPDFREFQAHLEQIRRSDLVHT